MSATDVARVTCRIEKCPQLSGPDGIETLSDTELLIVENGFIAPNKARLVKATFDTL